jgi:hypothetical protein
MSRLMIIVEFEVKPEHREAFIELMKNHARLSRAEDGCQQFDVLLPQTDPTACFWSRHGGTRQPSTFMRNCRGWRRTNKPISRGWSAEKRCAASQIESGRGGALNRRR